MAAKDRVYTQFKDSTGLLDIIEGLLEPEDDARQDIADFLAKRIDIDAAEGEQLKKLGQMIGINITGFPDNVLRALIEIKIIINRTPGNPDNMIDAAGILGRHLAVSPPAQDAQVFYEEVYPAGIQMGIDTEIEARFIPFFLNRLRETKPPGVRLDVTHSPGGTPLFSFAGAPGSSVAGFDDNQAPGAGGFYVSRLAA